MKRNETPDVKKMRPLTQDELEARVQGVVDEIVSGQSGGDLQWIETSDFVRRMQEFVVYN